MCHLHRGFLGREVSQLDLETLVCFLLLLQCFAHAAFHRELDHGPQVSDDICFRRRRLLLLHGVQGSVVVREQPREQQQEPNETKQIFHRASKRLAGRQSRRDMTGGRDKTQLDKIGHTPGH